MNIKKSEISTLLDRIQPSEGIMLLTTAIAVGVGTGLGAVLFIQLIALIQDAFFVSGNSSVGLSNAWIFALAPAK